MVACELNATALLLLLPLLLLLWLHVNQCCQSLGGARDGGRRPHLCAQAVALGNLPGARRGPRAVAVAVRRLEQARRIHAVAAQPRAAGAREVAAHGRRQADALAGLCHDARPASQRQQRGVHRAHRWGGAPFTSVAPKQLCGPPPPSCPIAVLPSWKTRSSTITVKKTKSSAGSSSSAAAAAVDRARHRAAREGRGRCTSRR
eukprot:scaffold4720_cov382-Prasinococcus_capsulatus_cf.AAC.9